MSQAPMPLYIYLPFQLAHAQIFLLRKHALLPLSSTFTSQLDKLLSDYRHSAHFYHFAASCPKWDQRSRHRQWAFSAHWLGPDGKDNHLQRLLDNLQCPNLPAPTPDPKSTAFTKWHDDFSPSSNSPAWVACLPSEGPSFLPPFICGVLSVASHCYFFTCLQLLFQHAFIAEYSDHFCTNAGNNTECPCGARST